MAVSAPVAGSRPVTTAQGRQAPAAQPVPFTRASRQKTALAFDTGAVNLGAATVQIAPVELPPAGFLRFIELACTLAGNNTSATVAFAADAPWNALAFVQVNNAAGDTIITPVTGFQLYLINKYGINSEDAPWCDPRLDPQYSVTTGTGATGGSAVFSLRIPFELDPRDAFCAVPNMAANKSYQIQMMFSATSAIYTTAPNGTGTIATFRVQGVSYFWSQPAAANAVGVPQQTQPLGTGSVSLWRLQTAPITPGDKYVQLVNVGNVLRTVIFTLRTAAGARDTADWPAIGYMLLNNDQVFYLPQTQWLADIANSFGYNLVTKSLDVAGGLDTGVYTIGNYTMSQRGRALCDSPRDQWLPTLDATLLQFHGSTFGASASTLEILTNEIKPISAAAMYSLNVF